VRVIGSVTLSYTFTSGKTGHLWRCHELFLAMDKAAVPMFAAPIEGTLQPLTYVICNMSHYIKNASADGLFNTLS
jgi:hypothetical protein